MKKYFTHLMAFVACLFVSTTANAQFSATIEMYPIDGWAGAAHEFQLQEVAQVLDVDAATLATALDAWMDETAPTEFLFQTADLVPTSLSDYTANSRGFWMTAEGAVVPYEEGKMYSAFSWDVDAGTFSVTLGQTQTAWAVGEEGHCNLVLAYNGHKATFDMTLKVIAEPSSEIDLASVIVLGEVTANLPQYQGSVTKQTLDLTGVAAIIGITDEELAANLGNYLFTSTMELRGESEESQKPYKTNLISKKSSASGIGWWFAAVWDEENDSWSEETARCVWGDHAAYRSMYAEQFSYDAATHELSFTTDFENSQLEIGTKFRFNLYFVNGINAYHINTVMTMTEKPYIDPSEFTEVGSETIEAEFDYIKGAYGLGNISIDLDAVLALLDCEASDIKSYALMDGEGNMSDDYDVANDGFWFNADGYVCKWASGYFYAGPTQQYGWGEWLVGQHPDKSENASNPVYTTKIFLVYGNKYYTINLKVTIKSVDPGDEVPMEEWESVATWNLSAQTLPTGNYPNVNLSGDYTVDNYPQIDLDALEAAIGTTNPTLYAWVKTDDGEEFTDDYSCTPYPGFWMDPDGYRSGWGSSCKVGFSYLSDGTFQLFQIPGGNQLGSVWKTTTFLVNKKNGKYVTINLTVIFGEAVQVEEVGETSITMGIGTSSNYYDVDFTEAVKGFGIEKIGDVLGSRCMRAVADDGTWTEHMAPGDGVPLNELGALDISPGNILAMAWIYAEPKDDNTVTFELEPGNIKIEPGKKVSTKLAFEYEPEGEEAIAKRFVVNITLTDEASLDGVNGIKADITSIEVYDLAGRRVTTAAPKGIYIVGGRKVVR